ncbi:MAG: maleylpyruvate isomerase N-terminal domain-containing protein [Planctomycetota bacterium]
MSRLPPILAVDLFREVCGRLHQLLGTLTLDEWHKPTSSSERNVKDIVSHLLDGSLRRLSMQRDGYQSPDAPRGFASDQELYAYLHRLNADWTQATRRLSPPVLVQLLAEADKAAADLFASIDPYSLAIFPVSWAGEQESLHWFDVARDFTEKWHHTQQIFEATGRPSTITERRLFHPCLDTFLRALPFTFRNVSASVGTVVAVEIVGEAGGVWYLERAAETWEQTLVPTGKISSRVVMSQESAWKLCTKRRSREVVQAQLPDIQIEGDSELGSHVLDLVSMIA